MKTISRVAPHALLPVMALASVVLLGGGGSVVTAQDKPVSKAHFDSDIAPVFNKYCTACHAGAQPRGDILLRFSDEADARSRAITSDDFWDKVAHEIETGVMPPATAKNRPTEGEKQLLVDWIRNDVLMGGKPDPGPLVVKRLNNREYANTMRDLLYLPADYDASADSRPMNAATASTTILRLW